MTFTGTQSALASTITSSGAGSGGTEFVLPTGPDATNRDDALSAPLSDGRRAWVMGDTFETGGPDQSRTHSNTAALTTAAAPGTLLDAVDANGHRSNFVPHNAGESAYNNGLRLHVAPPETLVNAQTANGFQNVAVDLTRFKNTAVSQVLLGVTATNLSGGVNDVKAARVFEPAATTSLLRLNAGETASTSTSTNLGIDSKVYLASPGNGATITVDLLGWFTNDSTDQFLTAISTREIYNTASCAPKRALGIETVKVQVTGASCKNASSAPAGATAALVSITADGTSSTATSTVQVWADGGTRPPSTQAAVRIAAHETRSALTVVPLSATGAISVANTAGTVGVSVRVEGYLGATSSYEMVPLLPVTVCDTSTSSACGSAGQITAGTPKTIAMPTTEVPGGADAVLLNVRATNVTGLGSATSSAVTVRASFQTIFDPALTAVPGAARSSMVLARVDRPADPSDGTPATIQVSVSTGSLDVVVDVLGFVATRAAITDKCPAGSSPRPRIAHWPTAVVSTAVAGPNGATDRVLVLYNTFFICGSFQFVFDHQGAGEYWYTANQATTTPMVVHRLNDLLDLGRTVYDWGSSAMVRPDNGVSYLYVYGCHTQSTSPEDPANGCSVARTPMPTSSSDVAFSKAANYRYWTTPGSATTADGTQWSAVANASVARRMTFDWSAVGTTYAQLPGAATSVEWISQIGAGGTYVMAYAPAGSPTAAKVILRTAPSPTGPWSAPVNGAAFSPVTGCQSANCYTYHVNPALSDATGLWFAYAANSTSNGLPITRLTWQRIPITIS